MTRRLLFAIAFACVVLPQNANAQRQPLGAADYALWGVSSALLITDWGQTHALLEQGESNPVLGLRPSHGAVNRYFVGVLAFNTLVSRVHGRELRRVIWAFVAGAELATVYRNQRVGVGWQFRW